MEQGMNYFYPNSVRRKRRNKIFSPVAPVYQNLFRSPNFVSAGICLSVERAICADRSRNRPGRPPHALAALAAHTNPASLRC